MAIFTPGPLAGQISGRLGATVFSHNRGGPYMRNGTIPTAVTSTYALNIKANLSARSAEWAGLTDAQRGAWTEWASQNPVTNRLGLQKTLSGHQAYIQLNHRIHQAGAAVIAVPPVADPPAALTSVVLDCDIGAGDTDITFAPTPLAAGVMLWVQAAVLNSPGVSYVTNLLKLVTISAAAQASPLDIETELTARFGSLAVGQKVVVLVSVFDSTTGLLSQPFKDEALVTTT